MAKKITWPRFKSSGIHSLTESSFPFTWWIQPLPTHFIWMGVWLYHIIQFMSFNFRSVGLNTTCLFYERSEHADADEENVWKSRLQVLSTWVPLTPGSLDIEDWRITRYVVLVVETGETFGESGGDVCQDLCWAAMFFLNFSVFFLS